MEKKGVEIAGCYIGGRWLFPNQSKMIEIKNPADGSLLARVPNCGQEEVHLAVKAAREAFESAEWKKIPPFKRGQILFEMAKRIQAHKDELAKLETLNVGKPLSQAKADVDIAIRYFEFYGGAADKIMGETIPVEPGIIDYTVREPLGVIAHIIPWNYPLQITARSIAVTIATGNACVIKPAEDTPLTTLKLMEIFETLPLPKGLINIVTGYGETGAMIASHPGVQHVTFTGSVETGKKVMAAASANVVPVTLELGGKSPNIVFADCNEERALDWVLRSIAQNAGQTCSAGSRLVIEKSYKDHFVKKLASAMKKLTIGPGMEDHDIGPVISKKQFNRIQSYLQMAKDEHLPIVTGGNRVHVEHCENGYYIEPTIIDNVPPDHPLAQEEIFGPVLVVIPFETEEEAIEIANGTPYGLVAGIWTEQIARAHRIASALQCGQVFINTYGAGGGVPMPFGGYKQSGFGREKGLEAIRNYTQVKNIAIHYF